MKKLGFVPGSTAEKLWYTAAMELTVTKVPRPRGRNRYDFEPLFNTMKLLNSEAAIHVAVPEGSRPASFRNIFILRGRKYGRIGSRADKKDGVIVAYYFWFMDMPAK